MGTIIVLLYYAVRHFIETLRPQATGGLQLAEAGEGIL